MGEKFVSSKTGHGVNTSLSTTAKAAGLIYLLSFAVVFAANFGITSQLVVKGNASATAQNILRHENLFRLSIVCDLLYCIGVISAAVLYYIILKPANKTLALLAAFLRFTFALAWILVAVHFFLAFRLISEDFLKPFPEGQLQALAKLFLNGFDAYYIGLAFWSLASVICSYLWFRSNYVPKGLVLFGFISSAWSLACTFAFLIFPSFSNAVNLWWFDSPMAVFEIALSFILLFKGIPGSKNQFSTI